VSDTTTPPGESGENQTPQDDWQSRYAGLQKVLSKRDTELTTANASLDQLRKEHEQAVADLATYRQRDVDASEEDDARRQYESLRARFEEAPPKPVGNNPTGGWTDARGDAVRGPIDRGAGWV
jgi:hypothetical protein